MSWLRCIALFATACALQPWVAGDPVLHVLLQMPLLALAGAYLPHRRALPRELVGAAFILALVSAAIWMLPRSVDAALTGWVGHIAKFTTLPLCVGVPLALSWPQLGPVLRGFVKAQSVSMLLLLGFLYTHAPLRICNSYLVSDQQRLGLGFAYLAIVLAIWWLIPVFCGANPFNLKGKHNELSRFGH